VFYDQIHLLFLEWGATQGDFLITLMALKHMDDFFEMSKWRIAYFFFLWTTIFAVKGCYLVFFRPFLRARGKAISYFYWFVVGLTVVSWILLVIGESVIVCPHVGKASSKSSMFDNPWNGTDSILVKCAPNLTATSNRVNIVLWLNAVLDAVTDVLSELPFVSSSYRMLILCSRHNSDLGLTHITHAASHKNRTRRLPLPFRLHARLFNYPRHRNSQQRGLKRLPMDHLLAARRGLYCHNHGFRHRLPFDAHRFERALR